MPSPASSTPSGAINPTLAATVAAWPLLSGMGLLMVGNGLLVTLLGMRAAIEGFPTVVTGVVMSGYFLGVFAGSLMTATILRRVGHVRAFAALASIASIASLAHSILVDPLTWTLMRAVTGFCFAGLYITAESWLNAGTANRTRGRMLAIYMLVQYGGLAAGQALLVSADPSGYELFIVSSIVVSAALVPILLSVRPAPTFEAARPLPLRELYRVSPLGFLGSICNGLIQGAFWGMGAVYAASIGLSVGWISLFVASATIGAAVLQWPIGHLSDVIGRRQVLAGITLLGALVCVAAGLLSGETPIALIGATGLFGGLALPVYSLCVAQANDYLKPEQMVAGSSGLVLLYACGSIFGPVSASAAMAGFGPNGFFWWLAVLMGGLGLFTVYRMIARAAKPVGEQGPYVTVVPRRSPLAASAIEEAAASDEDGARPA